MVTCVTNYTIYHFWDYVDLLLQRITVLIFVVVHYQAANYIAFFTDTQW
jgi:hypothetical protein